VSIQPLNLSRDERALAGRLGGLLWLTALPLTALALALPGIPGRSTAAALAIAGAATAWGVASAFFIRWERATSVPYHALAVISVVALAALIAATGAGHSALWPAYFLTVAYCSYFYLPTQAAGYVLACVVAQALPIAYAPGSVSESFVGEIAVAAVAYVAVGSVIVIGKRQLSGLRQTAEHLSRHDPLTGLANRRAFEDDLEQRLRHRPLSDAVALFLVDLDNFKEVNTRHGLPGGDRTLRAVAAALSMTVRPEDTVARLGGDEFAVLATGRPEAFAGVADRLIAAIETEGDRFASLPQRIGASIGWARDPVDAVGAPALLAAADDSLRTAKALGKGVSHSPEHQLGEPRVAQSSRLP
jgi:diguanylate cyclase (GGDEF)-like protein